MDETFVRKMIRNCFYQYNHTEESVPLSDKDYEVLFTKILALHRQSAETELHEIIEDVVYEYLTK
ncbi:YqzH family protein [Bacillus sp. 165]|uniref:YqzH family protein n=1 Tax=Bacillus sp. 165 TaxID=1529117 RepID=UPI001ADCB855|nr:YqzH family protein [Bacillus sp. 165]MBO9129759.1 hypothetical protein [Bacillus sp. 165]